MSDAPEASPEAPLLCRCGHGEVHEHVVEDPVYRGLDILWMLMGVSTRAVPYARKCARCGFVFRMLPPRLPW